MRAAVVVALSLLCVGCRSKSGADASAVAASPEWLEGRLPAETGSPTDGGTLVVRVMSEPATLNFLDDGSHDAWVNRMVGRLVTDSLFELSPTDFSLQPGLAASWVDSEDHRTTRLQLRPSATFSDGAPCEAADVVATLDAVMKGPHPTGVVRGELTGLEGWSVVDARTVELRWASPSPFSLRALSRVPIFGRRQLAADWAALGQRPLGTGPFAVEQWQHGVSLTLKRRPGAGVPLDTIVFRFVKDHTAATALFERGEVDLMTQVQPTVWRALEKNEPSTAWARTGWHRIRSVDNSYSYIGWNEARPGLSEVRVRRALAQLYDADLVSQVVDLGLELPTRCPYFRDGPSCSPTLEPLPYAPAQARAVLADAGVHFTFLLPANSVRLGKLVPMLQEQFEGAGVAMTVEKVETATLSARVARRDFDVVSRVWTEFDREQDLYPMFHSSQIDGGSNFVGYASPEADALLEAIRREFDEPKRRALEHQLHERLYADQPYLFMTNRQSLDAAKHRVHGLQPSVLWYDLRRVWVSN